MTIFYYWEDSDCGYDDGRTYCDACKMELMLTCVNYLSVPSPRVWMDR